MAEKAGEDTVALEEQKAKRYKELKNNKLRDSLDALNESLENVKQIFGEETKAGKAAAVAQATINTYSAATAALDDAPVPFNFILAATTIAAGLQNINKILSVQSHNLHKVVW